MNINLKKIFSKVELKADIDPLKWEPQVVRDWHWILVGAAALLLVVAGGTWFIYGLVVRSQVIPAATTINMSEAQLKKTSAELQTKDLIFESYRLNKPTVSEPKR